MSGVDTQVHRETLEADLARRFQVFLNRLPASALERAIKLQGEEVFAELARAAIEEPLSIETRNQLAVARMRKRAHEKLKQRCTLLKSSDVCDVLNFSKETLSKRVQAGQIIAYTDGNRRGYPDFQFEGNKVRPVIGRLVSELGLNVSDSSEMNDFVQHLASKIDFSDPGEDENLVCRFEVLDNPAGYAITKLDYENRYEMGK
ncbi:hypothetical protein D3C77_540160 [compost metagenome]